MIFKKVADPAALREEDNRRAESIEQAAKIDYTMMMLDVDFPTTGEGEENAQPEI